MKAEANREVRYKEVAVSLITKHLGQIAGRMYREFYTGKPMNQVEQSVTEIMIEYLGEPKAKQELIVLSL